MINGHTADVFAERSPMSIRFTVFFVNRFADTFVLPSASSEESEVNFTCFVN